VAGVDVFGPWSDADEGPGRLAAPTLGSACTLQGAAGAQPGSHVKRLMMTMKSASVTWVSALQRSTRASMYSTVDHEQPPLRIGGLLDPRQSSL
jgi:hypothetical protein